MREAWTRRAVLRGAARSAAAAVGGAALPVALMGCSGADAAHRRVLLVLVEGLRADFGRRVVPGLALPALDGLVAAGSLAVLPAAAATGRASVASLWTGRTNRALGVFGDEYALPEARPGAAAETVAARAAAMGVAAHGFGRLFDAGRLGDAGWSTLTAEAKGVTRYQTARGERLAREAAAGDALLRPGPERRGPLVEVAADPIEARYADVLHTALAVERLVALRASARPWLCAVSLESAALPWCVPARLVDGVGEVVLPGAGGARAWDRQMDSARAYTEWPALADAIGAYAAALRLVDECVARLVDAAGGDAVVVLGSTQGVGLGEAGVVGDGALTDAVVQAPWVLPRGVVLSGPARLGEALGYAAVVETTDTVKPTSLETVATHGGAVGFRDGLGGERWEVAKRRGRVLPGVRPRG